MFKLGWGHCTKYLIVSKAGGGTPHIPIEWKNKGGDTAHNFCTKGGDTAHNLQSKVWDTARNVCTKGGDTALNFQTRCQGGGAQWASTGLY